MTKADAELLRLFGEFRRAWSAFAAQSDDDEATEEQAAALHGEYRAVVDAMQKIEASSLVGLCAKAQVYTVATEHDGGEAYGDLARNVVADCLRLGRVRCPAAMRALEGVQS